MMNDFCFVQYCEIVLSDTIDMDDIEKQLNCLVLRWERKDHTSTLSAARSFGLVRFASLGGFTHVVKGDTMPVPLYREVARRQQLQNFRNVFYAWSGAFST